MDVIPVANPSPIRRLHGTRAALITLALISAAVSCAVLAIAFALPSDQEAPGAIVSGGSVDSLTVGEPTLNSEGGFWLVKLDSDEVLALSRRDPHIRHCSIPWRPQFQFQGTTGWFRDPCGGSTYDISGNQVSGPSPRSMDRFSVLVENDEVRVNTAYRICSDGEVSFDDGCRRVPPVGWPDPFQ